MQEGQEEKWGLCAIERNQPKAISNKCMEMGCAGRGMVWKGSMDKRVGGS